MQSSADSQHFAESFHKDRELCPGRLHVQKTRQEQGTEIKHVDVSTWLLEGYH